MRRRHLVLVLLLFSFNVFMPWLRAQPVDREAVWARQIFQATNQVRARHGLPPFAWSPSLAAAARAHLSVMVHQPELSHDYPGEPPLPVRAAQAGAHFETIAENIAMGYSVPAIQNEWMHSPPHRANILNPRLNAAGVAIAKRRGNFYAVVDFAAAVQHQDRSQATRQITQLLRQIGISPGGSRSAARAACAPGYRLTAGTPVRLLVRFTTPDLNRLPAQVTSEIQSSGATHAAVALCPSDGSQPGFTTYSVALLLY
jgi:uncharacterized protein YkwD